MGRQSGCAQWFRPFMAVLALTALADDAFGQHFLNGTHDCPNCERRSFWDVWPKISLPPKQAGGRHRGIGDPMVGTSWLNRPWHVGWLFGNIQGDALIDGRVDQQTGLIGGYRFGHDFDHFFGTEARFSFSHPSIAYTPATTASGKSDILLFDLNLMYYPLGDSRWRPFASAGMGIANYGFTDDQGAGIEQYLFHVPIGVGMKYAHKPWLAWRVDLMDNIAIGSSGIDTMNNLTFTFGVEVHFGGRKKSYYPWNPGIRRW